MPETYKVVYFCSKEPPRELIEPVLSSVGAHLVVAALSKDDDAVIAACHDADGVIVQGGGRFTRLALSALSRCQVIVKTGVGVDGYDVDFATERGILVGNTPGGNAPEVADLTMGLIIAATRHFLSLHEYVRSGRWADHEPKRSGTFHRLGSRTLGLFGLGNVGKVVARHAQGFGTTVVAHDPYVTPETAAAIGVELLDKEDLLRRSDIVSIHAPLTRETRRAIGGYELSLMRNGAYLINTARGAIVDTAALTEALRSSHLAGAGLDVTDPEPLPLDHPLLHMENVIITAHSGSGSEEGALENSVTAARFVADALQGRVPAAAVNPEAVRNRVSIS